MRPTILTLGSAQLGLAYGVANERGLPSESEAFAILDAAFEHGIRSIDTASAYGDAERRIGLWLRARSHPDVVVTTKLRGLPAESTASADIASFVRNEIESSLRRLARDHVDYLLLHRPEDLRIPGPRADALADALHKAVDDQLVRSVGVSMLAIDDVAVVTKDARMSAIQVPLNLLDRRVRDGGHLSALSALAARDAVVFARSPFLQGALSMEPARFTDAKRLPARLAHVAPWLRRVHDVCAAHGGTAASFALAWCARQPGVTSVVVGADDVAQVKANAEAVQRTIPADLERAITAMDEPPLDVIDPSRWPAQ